MATNTIEPVDFRPIDARGSDELTLLAHIRAYVVQSGRYIPVHYVDEWLQVCDDVDALYAAEEKRVAA